MKSVLRITIISITILVVLGGAGFWFIQQLSSKGGDEITAVAEEIEQREETVETEQEKVAAPIDADIDEGRLQTLLHQMTHQKVIADKKRGAIEMSQANIESMLTIVRANKDHYKHSDFYEETLTAWEQGDFSNAVTVHNTIWDWHAGTVGRATGLMNAEQEAAYVKKNFR